MVGFVGSSALDVLNKSRVVVEMVMDRVVFTHHNVRAMRLNQVIERRSIVSLSRNATRLSLSSSYFPSF